LRTYESIRARLAGCLLRLRDWWQSQTLRFRIRAWAGDRYRAVQPLLTKPQDYETFIRLGHMELTIRVGGRQFEGIDAAPVARRLWDRNLLFSDPDVEYDLESGETVRDPGDVAPGTVIEEIRMQNRVRVPGDFLD